MLNRDVRTEAFQIMKNVTQGCVLSHLLFNIYLERFSNQLFLMGILGLRSIERELTTSNIQMTAIVAGDLSEIQHIIDRVSNVGKKFGVRINVQKIKLMVVKRDYNSHKQ